MSVVGPTRELTRVGSRTVGAGLGRIAAALALASAVVHVVSVTTSSLGSLAMAGMALACLPCAWHLWSAPTVPVWTLTALIDLGMVALHAPMLAASGHAPGHGGAAGHVHGAESMWLALALVVGSLALSTVAITTAACTRDRRKARPEGAHPTPRVAAAPVSRPRQPRSRPMPPVLRKIADGIRLGQMSAGSDGRRAARR